jgi:hypothetical protein
MDTFSDIARERLRLPIRNKGCGLRDAKDRQLAQYIGAAAQSIQQLGRTRMVTQSPDDRTSLVLLTTLGQKASITHPCIPWEQIMSNETSTCRVAKGYSRNLEPVNPYLPGYLNTSAD